MGEKKPESGAVGWIDLTVENAEEVRDFYAQVVGWKPEAVEMDGYSDFCMTTTETATPTTGVCHRRGPNENLPGGWLIYINVDDLDASLARVAELGGRVVAGPKAADSSGRYGTIEDPSGATCALFEPA